MTSLTGSVASTQAICTRGRHDLARPCAARRRPSAAPGGRSRCRACPRSPSVRPARPARRRTGPSGAPPAARRPSARTIALAEPLSSLDRAGHHGGEPALEAPGCARAVGSGLRDARSSSAPARRRSSWRSSRAPGRARPRCRAPPPRACRVLSSGPSISCGDRGLGEEADDQVGQGDPDLGAGELGGQGPQRRPHALRPDGRPRPAARSTAARSTVTRAYSAAPKTPHASTRPTEIAEQQPLHAAHCGGWRLAGRVGRPWERVHLDREPSAGTVDRVDSTLGHRATTEVGRVLRFSGVAVSHVGLVRTRQRGLRLRRADLHARRRRRRRRAAGEVASATAAYVVSASRPGARRAATRPACCGSAVAEAQAPGAPRRAARPGAHAAWRPR